jgi:phosphoribosylformylglycinamidine synthase subunit PurL
VVCAGGVAAGGHQLPQLRQPLQTRGLLDQFKEASAGWATPAARFDTPVTGGNVSFYNENPNGAVYPTPVIGMLGLIDDIDHITQAGFRGEGDTVILLGRNRNEICGSEYLASWHGIVGGDAPFLDLDEEHRLHGLLLSLIRDGKVRSAHDVSDGGLAVCLAECCFLGEQQVGATLSIPLGELRKDALYFGESQSRVVISCKATDAAAVLADAAKAGIEAAEIGATGGSSLRINDDIDAAVAALASAHANALEKILEQK